MIPAIGERMKRPKRFIFLVFIFFVILVHISCDLILDAAIRAAGGSNKEITEFNFQAALNGNAGVTSDCHGVIAGTQITVMVPYGTNLAALVANFSTSGVSVLVGSALQESGITANDFTRPVIYTVTAADKSTANYNVRVQPYPSSAKAITSFSLVSPAATGTIDEEAKTIAVTVPNGTNLTALVAVFATTGVSVKVGPTVQVSGTTANDFTNPVSYTVTAADSSSVSYTVTVTIDLTAKAITSFSFVSPAVTGTIDEDAKTIAVTVPYGTDVTSLVSIFTTTGVSVKVGSTVQVSGTTANDFTNPASYTVTAADSSSVSYTVTVTIDLTAKAITAFSCVSPAATGTINEGAKTIAVTVPYGTKLTALIVIFTTTGASVKVGSVEQVSGITVNNFTSPITYMVTAHDNSTVSYLVTITVAPAVWHVVGSAGFTAGNASKPTLAIDSSDIPYVAYQDYDYGLKATVMSFASGTWQIVGTAGFSAGAAGETFVAIDPTTDTPYVAFKDWANGGKATVMKYASGSWQVLGAAGFSAGEAGDLCLAINSLGIPYVAYRDYANGYKATAMKYEDGSWQTLGVGGFSAGNAQHISLDIDMSGIPYVAYMDYANGWKATVMRYVGSSWQAVGTIVSSGEVYHTTLAIDASNTPWVAYRDYDSYSGITVMRYVSGSWQRVGGTKFGEGGNSGIPLAIDSLGTPYVAYFDNITFPRNFIVSTYSGSWQVLGSGFGLAYLPYFSMSIDSSDNPYVVFEDSNMNEKLTVMRPE